MKKVILVLIIVVLLSACAPKVEGIRTLIDNTNPIVQRYIDTEMEIVCYSLYANAISCVSVSMP